MAEPKTTAAPPESPNPIKATRPNPPSSLQSSAGAFATRRRPDPRFLTADSMRFGRCYPTRLELRGARTDARRFGPPFLETRVSRGVPFRKTGRAERVPGFAQAPDFFVPSD